jgi:hypothetical protein
MAEPYIDYAHYTQICQTAQVTETQAQEVLVEYLSDLGIVLHFTGLALEDTHVLEPKWVTNHRSQPPVGNALPRSSASRVAKTVVNDNKYSSEAELRGSAFPSRTWER